METAGTSAFPRRRAASPAVIAARINAVDAVVRLARTESPLDDIQKRVACAPCPEPEKNETQGIEPADRIAKLKAHIRGMMTTVEQTIAPVIRQIVSSDPSIEVLEAADESAWDDLEALVDLRKRLADGQPIRAQLADIILLIRKFDEQLVSDSLRETLTMSDEWNARVVALVNSRLQTAMKRLHEDTKAQADEAGEVASEWSAVDSDGWDGSEETHSG